MTTGERIKQLRLSLGMTQEQLGEKIGVKKAAINKYETGIVVNLKKSTISSLAKALNVSPLFLLYEDDSDLSVDEKHLVDLYRGADARAQADAVRTLEEHQIKKDTEHSAI
ncbi:MAG: helix-turn-helix transcriptional regulator [Oscillospiraceae bacterium]|jgi:transcriptional regulator with XRE-family HTH domain|nr:helix-turn-helix transcriptional regulator [Oscillospiraceae bacterium]